VTGRRGSSRGPAARPGRAAEWAGRMERTGLPMKCAWVLTNAVHVPARENIQKRAKDQESSWRLHAPLGRSVGQSCGRTRDNNCQWRVSLRKTNIDSRDIHGPPGGDRDLYHDNRGERKKAQMARFSKAARIARRTVCIANRKNMWADVGKANGYIILESPAEAMWW